MAVNCNNFLAFFGVADVDEGILQSGLELIGHDLRGLAHADSIVVNGRSYTNDIGFVPDGSSAAVLALPLVGIVTTDIGIGYQHIHLTRSQTGHSAAVGIRRNCIGQVSNALAIVLLEPQSRIDVTSRRRGRHYAPLGAVQIVPGQFLTGIDLGTQLLTLLRRTSNNQGTIGYSLIGGSFGGLVVVPVLGTVRINAQTVTGGSQDYFGAIVIQYIGTAGDQTYIGCTGRKALAYGFIAGTNCDLHIAYIVAFLRQLGLEHLLEGLGSSDDLIGFPGGNKCNSQGIDLDIAVLSNRRAVVAAGAGCHGSAQSRCHQH